MSQTESKSIHPLPKKKVIKRLVKNCLREDIGSGDVTARLTPKESQVDGKIISREDGIICGVAWVDEVFKQVGKRHKTKITVEWHVNDGDIVKPDQTLCRFEGFAHPILSGERTHRMGLYDGIIIKENHLRSGKSLERIVTDAIASMPNDALVELEVETIEELERGLHAGAKRIMLDDFSMADMRLAVELTGDQADLEASGNVNIKTIASIAETGVDFISSGAITKHVRALDLSMLFDYK